jgi:hypothetical protein
MTHSLGNSQSEENYEVDDVLDYNVATDEYLIRWYNYNVVKSTWEPSSEEFKNTWDAKSNKEKKKCKRKWQTERKNKEPNIVHRQKKNWYSTYDRSQVKESSKQLRPFWKSEANQQLEVDA